MHFSEHLKEPHLSSFEIRPTDPDEIMDAIKTFQSSKKVWP